MATPHRRRNISEQLTRIHDGVELRSWYVEKVQPAQESTCEKHRLALALSRATEPVAARPRARFWHPTRSDITSRAHMLINLTRDLAAPSWHNACGACTVHQAPPTAEAAFASMTITASTLGAAGGAPFFASVNITSTARGTPPALCRRPAHSLAFSRYAFSEQTWRKRSATSARYCATAAASCPASGSGLGTCKPTPMTSAFSAFTTWSPKPGHTSSGTPLAKPSVKLFCPPCVRKASTPKRSTSTCGTTGKHNALAGGSRSPNGSA
mmetsp:Transcript_78656/g.255356  ORF Transcript_78656/g.255356 Transcript_78656/m.255356 type:complete len:268 (-) Transcript_78656:1180-1983(-)